MAAEDILSPDEKEFLKKCEEEFKDRYTENDEEFMKIFNKDPSKPPIIESWWTPQNFGRRNDRRHNRRYNPYDRQGNRDFNRRDNHDRREYSDYNRGNDDRQYGYRNQRPRYY